MEIRNWVQHRWRSSWSDDARRFKSIKPSGAITSSHQKPHFPALARARSVQARSGLAAWQQLVVAAYIQKHLAEIHNGPRAGPFCLSKFKLLQPAIQTVIRNTAVSLCRSTTDRASRGAVIYRRRSADWRRSKKAICANRTPTTTASAQPKLSKLWLRYAKHNQIPHDLRAIDWSVTNRHVIRTRHKPSGAGETQRTARRRHCHRRRTCREKSHGMQQIRAHVGDTYHAASHNALGRRRAGTGGQVFRILADVCLVSLSRLAVARADTPDASLAR